MYPDATVQPRCAPAAETSPGVGTATAAAPGAAGSAAAEAPATVERDSMYTDKALLTRVLSIETRCTPTLVESLGGASISSYMRATETA